MTDPKDKTILEAVELLDEQHEMIAFLLELIPKNDKCGPEIETAMARIGQKIKDLKSTWATIARWQERGG